MAADLLISFILILGAIPLNNFLTSLPSLQAFNTMRSPSLRSLTIGSNIFSKGAMSSSVKSATRDLNSAHFSFSDLSTHTEPLQDKTLRIPPNESVAFSSFYSFVASCI